MARKKMAAIEFPSVDSLFTSQEEREAERSEREVLVPVDAVELAGLAEVPCVVRDLGEDEATIAMVGSNMQRETILPSERAFAYSMRLEAMKRQGQRTDLTCARFAHKLDGRRSRDILAEELGVSKDKVQRYIRLTFLVPELLQLVDEGRMKLFPAVEVSYLSRDE